ncbi:MAG TPA: hypothetical protein VE422_45815 [Terriglobia bacterium]|nr:hypothetical protein [Terriglobia bacterium]
MKPINDPLISRSNADRLHYSIGELLGADDFRDEQTYHRRQLARALLYLHGSGTIAGLRVTHKHQPKKKDEQEEVELEVRPGLALDHAGRLIEVPEKACLRLRRWYEFIAASPAVTNELDAEDLRNAWRPNDSDNPGGPGVVVADVVLSFYPCDRGYTPAFASGPFDALDASQPSRIRDGYELSLIPRSERDDKLPAAGDPWAALAALPPDKRLAAALDISLDLWRDRAKEAKENPDGVDSTAVLLARLRLPTQKQGIAPEAPLPDWKAGAWATDGANLNNNVRRVLLPPQAVFNIIAL